MAQTYDITLLLQAWQNGDAKAQDELFQTVYGELRRIAQNRLRGEGRKNDLQATEIVHEIFPQLAKQRQPWQNRSQFYALASECMRRFLVDHARTRRRQKRGGDAYQVSFADLKPTEICRIENFDEVLAVNDALDKLAELNKMQADVIKLRYFGGLAREEIGGLLDVSPATIDRSYRVAKAWLRRELAFQFSPYLLRTSEIKSPAGFVGLFKDSENMYGNILRLQLPEDRLTQLRNAENDGESLLPALVGVVNKLMLSNLLFPVALIDDLPLNGETKQLVRTQLPVEETIRLNRRLFEAAFPNVVERIF